MSTIKVPRKQVLARLRDGDDWAQGTWGSDGKVCLHGAIRECCPIPGDAFLIQRVAERKGWGTGWNDDDSTEWSDVRDLLTSRRATVTDADLADTFGPQWEPIVALVRRAAVLTGVAASRLAAAWDATTDATWVAARGAAWGAERDAARGAAGVAARDATGVAARDTTTGAAGVAARAAARALVVRDLIGQHGFTQQHYDTLTLPWRTVIGPLHPDDAGVPPKEDNDV